MKNLLAVGMLLAMLMLGGCKKDSTYQGVTLTDWIKLSHDNDYETSKKAFDALRKFDYSDHARIAREMSTSYNVNGMITWYWCGSDGDRSLAGKKICDSLASGLKEDVCVLDKDDIGYLPGLEPKLIPILETYIASASAASKNDLGKEYTVRNARALIDRLK